MPEAPIVEVRAWNRRVGAVAPLAGKPGFYEFQYAPGFELEVAPLQMPAAPLRRYSFPSLSQETFQGLPGALADSLPDRFGNLLIDEYMARKGIRAQDVSTLDRLLYIGRRGMGALEFEPAMRPGDAPGATAPLEMGSLVEDARRALRGEAGRITQEIIDVGSSAGGARAKAVIGWNRATDEIVSGQFDLAPGFEHWLLKFDVGEDKRLGTTRGFGRIEYAHHLMARDAGIAMTPCHLLEENGRAHFMTQRFDRHGNERLHVQSLCALSHLDFNVPYAHSYEQYLRTVLQLKLGAQAVEQAWLRCAFNVAFVNCDDHTKNLAFLMTPAGAWSLAPAFDVCFAHNPAPDRWTHKHQMLLKGKAWDITREDLIEVASQFGVNQPGPRLDAMLDVRNRWPEYAKTCGIPKAKADAIASFHPSL